MENNTSTTKFKNLNFNLKKIIFSYLKPYDQKTIYWINKKLRPLLPDSPMRINMNSLKKYRTYQSDCGIDHILELNDGNILFFTNAGINLLKFDAHKFEMIKSFPFNAEYWTLPIQLQNDNIIYRSDSKELRICDKDLNVIETLKDSSYTSSTCNLSELSFAVGLKNGTVKIYSRNRETLKYEVVKEYQCHSDNVYDLLYLPKKNYLLSRSYNKTINVINLSEGTSIQILTDHSNPVTSLISLNDETFASGSRGEIKIWSIKADATIECIKTINAHGESRNVIILHNLGNDFMISQSADEFKIWDLKTYECLGTYIEDYFNLPLKVIKNNYIITCTENKKVNLWRVLV
jgi:WD40 repeat protein